jgi:hypothetical protein
MGQRAASAASREALALLGAVDVAPHVGSELRDDLRCLRVEAFALRERADCPADHALASPRRTALRVAPSDVALADLARAVAIAPDDDVVLAARELAVAVACPACGDVQDAARRADRPLGACARCRGPLAALRRARRLRWADAGPLAAGLAAGAWFDPGDVLAIEGPRGARSVAFPALGPAWEPAAAWDERSARARYARLPACYDLARIRRARVAVLGLGHVGAAALQQLAPLPWAGLLLVDRDAIALHNLQAHPFAAARPDVVLDAAGADASPT